jgi:serine/threonine protein kinase
MPGAPLTPQFISYLQRSRRLALLGSKSHCAQNCAHPEPRAPSRFACAGGRRHAHHDAHGQARNRGHAVLHVAGAVAGQASGREIDARTDIFSFGLVLYEMLTGKRAFDGATQVSVIAAIMERPAPSIVDVAPLALDRLLKKCLEKDPDNRWQTARDLKDELEWIAQGSTTESPPSRATKLPWIVAAVMTLVAVFGWMLFELRTSRPEAAAPSEVSFTIPPPSGKELAHLGQMSADSLSPDGSMILFRGSDGFTSDN